MYRNPMPSGRDNIPPKLHQQRVAVREGRASPVPSAVTITLPLPDVRALVALAWEQTRYIEMTDKSATASIYGIEYADTTIARVAVRIPEAYRPKA